MGLNKKALKLAAYKRRGKDSKVILGRRTILSMDPGTNDRPAMLVADVQRERIGTGQWKYGKYPRCKPGFEDVIVSANLLTNVMPVSRDPIVKEVDADTNELTIEFTAIKTGCEALDLAMASGITAGQWSTIEPRNSALAPSINQAIARHIEAECQKVWVDLTGGK